MRLSATLHTHRGPIRLRLHAERAPLTVANFVNLARRGFYDGLCFHRVIDEFMIHSGCPEGRGRGGPGYHFEDEIDPSLRPERAGVLSMANAGPGSNGSQFFITHVATPWLDGRHAVFGQAIDEADMAVVHSIAQGDVIERVDLQGDIEALLTAQAQRVATWDAALDALD